MCLALQASKVVKVGRGEKWKVTGVTFGKLELWMVGWLAACKQSFWLAAD